MKNKEPTNINLCENGSVRADIKKPYSDVKILSYGIENPLENLRNKKYKDTVQRNNLLLDVIREKSPISKYELAKISLLSYACIKTVTKFFAFCDLIYIKNSISSNGQAVKLISIKENKIDTEFKTKGEGQIKVPSNSRKDGEVLDD